MAFEFACPNAPVDTPGLLPDTNGDTWGVWKLMPGLPPPSSGSPTEAEWSGEHSLAGTLGSLIAEAGLGSAKNDTLALNKPPTISLREIRRRVGTAARTASCASRVSSRSAVRIFVIRFLPWL